MIINPDRLTALKVALNALGIREMTVTHVEGWGAQLGVVG